MTQFFILPEDIDPPAIDEFLSDFDKFLTKILPNWDGDFSSYVTKMDEKFIENYAEGFHELREIGTAGLKKKYVGRYFISLYSGIPLWVQEGLKSMTKAQLIEIKEKTKESDW